MCVVEDAKVSIDELQEKIQDFEDFVQSCDVAAMNKIQILCETFNSSLIDTFI